jgi:hypothetical protein
MYIAQDTKAKDEKKLFGEMKNRICSSTRKALQNNPPWWGFWDKIKLKISSWWCLKKGKYETFSRFFVMQP